MNDPNGPIRWRGRYHVFFQYNPAAPVHDSICWGHASSADLVRWDDEPVALRPTPGGPDAAGCWSGCVVDDGGVATAVYTGTPTGPDTAVICTATSNDDRLHAWTKNPRPVAVPPPQPALRAFRDPFVFVLDGHRYAVVGAGGPEAGTAMVLLYRCDDLRHWTYLGVLLDTSDGLARGLAPADVWECPQLVEVGGHWVLIVSKVVEPNLDRVAYLLGRVVATDAGPRFLPETGGLVDHGHDFYAPAVLRDGDRVLLWGWTWEDHPAGAAREDTWAGALTLARELTVSGDRRLRSRPVAELAGLHGGRRVRTLGPGERVAVSPGPVDLLVEIAADADGALTLDVGRGLRLDLDLGASLAAVRRTVHEPARRHWTTSGRFSRRDGPVSVRIIVDGSVVELFVEDGPTFTERVYEPGPLDLAVAGGPGVRVTVVERRLRHAVTATAHGAR